MNNSTFFPNLTRKPEAHYHNRNGRFYADYRKNYKKVSSDCLKRCVYCDATEKECGGDRFSLDHFRPKHVFEDKFGGILLTHPHNLHLSCQKCNVLKSSDWKGCTVNIHGETYSNREGYIDRFKHDCMTYFKVNSTGVLESTNSEGPADYMIKKLMLNRPNRVYIRNKRHLNKRMQCFFEQLTNVNDSIIERAKDGQLETTDMLNLLSRIAEIYKEFRMLT